MKSKAAILVIFISVLFFSVSDFVFAQGSCPSPPPTLRRGSQGDCVRFLEIFLSTLLDISPPLQEDGIFDEDTEGVVISFQQLNNLRVDGIVGRETWNAINQTLSNQPAQPQTQQQQQQPPGYNLPPLPTGTGLTQDVILNDILVRFANFLIAIGVILAIITIVVSGIMFFWAKSDTEAKNAKGWFRNGLIGAFIILAVGVIILTIYNIVVNRTFFGGSGIPPGGQQPPAPVQGDSGSPCQNDRECTGGLECKGTRIFGTGPKTCQNP